jgi:hypothetical protein
MAVRFILPSDIDAKTAIIYAVNSVDWQDQFDDHRSM